MALPQLQPSRDDPRDEDDGVFHPQPLLVQLDPRGVRQGAGDGLGDVLREGGWHGVVEEEKQPPYGAHEADHPAAAVHARPPLPLLPLRRGRRKGLVVVVVVVVFGCVGVCVGVGFGKGFPPAGDRRHGETLTPTLP